MLRTKTLLLFALIMLPAIPKLHAQTVSYKISYNDPYDLRNLKINLNPLVFEMRGGVSAGASIQANYLLGKVATFEALVYYGAYWHPKLSAEKEIKALSTNALSTPLHIEAGGEWHFSDRLVNRKLTILLDKGYNSETSMRIPLKARKIYSLRGGISQSNYYIMGSDSMPFIGDDDKKFGANYNTNAHTQILYAGIGTRRIDKAGISTDSYGGRRRNRNRQLFLDVLFGVTALDKIKEKGSGKEYSISNTPTDNIGFRFGGEWMDNGTFLRLELGTMPGMKRDFINPLLNLSFGFTVWGNEKGLKKSKAGGN